MLIEENNQLKQRIQYIENHPLIVEKIVEVPIERRIYI